MKRVFLAVILLLLFFSVVLAESNTWFDDSKLDWFSKQSAEEAQIPDGLTEREAEIYRAGFAYGHFDALHPAFEKGKFVLNTKTKKFHLTNCLTTLLIDSKNREHSTLSAEQLMEQGYKPCGQCNPQR